VTRGTDKGRPSVGGEEIKKGRGGRGRRRGGGGERGSEKNRRWEKTNVGEAEWPGNDRVS